MKAVITGATGFIGSNLVRHLTEQGWSISVIVRESSVASAKFPSGVDIITDRETDIAGDELTRKLESAKADVVFHLASLFLAAHQPSDLHRLIESNVLFGTRLLESMHRAGVRRLVNTGTAWQHLENRMRNPVNLYAATKSAFDNIIDYYVEAKGLNAITLKLFDTYGPNDPRAKLIHLLMKTAKGQAKLEMSPGEQKIDLVHIHDVVAAFQTAAERLMASNTSSPVHEEYVVTSGASVSLRELVNIFERATDTKLQIEWGRRPYREREVMIPYELGKTLPGWKAQVPLADGLSGIYRNFAG